MSERFETFGNIIKDNEQMPNLLDNYQATIRLNEFAKRISELEEQLKKSRIKYFIGLDGIDFDWCVKELDLNIILPKWMYDNDFKFYDTKEEALAKLEELKGENK